MTISQHTTQPSEASEWFARRTYRREQFADAGALAARKAELGLSLTVVLPAREVASTVGEIVDGIRDLNERAPLVDQVAVVDAGSADGSADVAREHGAEVYQQDELLPDFGPAIGKGDAMWRALSIARGDLVAYLDSDTTDFDARFVCGLLGPMLDDPEVRFVKGAYSRPFRSPDGEVLDDAGRVTELTAKPLFSLFFPELCGFGQPLSGEIAAPRSLLASIPFCTGYAVEAAMMIDVLRAVGLDAMAQVELGTRHNRYQPLFALGAMAYAVLRGVLARLGPEGAIGRDLDELHSYAHAICSVEGTQFVSDDVEVVERPPFAELDA